MKKHQSLIIFENPHLERLTHVHPIIPLVLWAPIVAYLVWRSLVIDSFSPSVLLGTAAAGFALWTISEYLLHRYVFHFKPKNKWQYKLYFIIHGNHHDDPNDPSRLVMPPAGSLILGVLFYSFYRIPLGAALVDPFFCGFAIGYLAYDYTHYAIHHFKPLTAYGRFNKQHHMLHHFVDHEARWGVSSPLWDHVFNTVSERKPHPASQRAARENRAPREAERGQTV